jgi:SUMO ligase MMS21 Smc5/6 complex component
MVFQLTGLRKSAEQLVLLDQETSDRSNVCIEVRRRIVRETHNGEPANGDVELYKMELAKREELRPAVEHADAGRYLKDIDSAIKDISNEGDEPVVAGGRVVASRCPITGTDLVNPVANKTCGHVYSTSGIIGYIWQTSGRKSAPPTKLENIPEFLSVACPNAGCNAQVSRSSLARDFMTERSQRRAHLETATQNQTEDHEIVEDLEDLVD